jgi:predicted nucleic acid-binding Zn ribbon protein
MKSKTCMVCGNDFVVKHANEKICSDVCKEIRKKEHERANTQRQIEIYKETNSLKPKRCHTPKCKNIVHKQMPDGRELCRTCLAKHNVYGGVDKPSPTTKSYKPGAMYRDGFNRTSARRDVIRANEEFQGRLDDLKHKKRKQFFAIRRSKGQNPATKAFRDFKRDAPRR